MNKIIKTIIVRQNIIISIETLYCKGFCPLSLPTGQAGFGEGGGEVTQKQYGFQVSAKTRIIKALRKERSRIVNHKQGPVRCCGNWFAFHSNNFSEDDVALIPSTSIK
jgi:hypothetical protein